MISLRIDGLHPLKTLEEQNSALLNELKNVRLQYKSAKEDVEKLNGKLAEYQVFKRFLLLSGKFTFRDNHALNCFKAYSAVSYEPANERQLWMWQSAEDCDVAAWCIGPLVSTQTINLLMFTYRMHTHQ